MNPLNLLYLLLYHSFAVKTDEHLAVWGIWGYSPLTDPTVFIKIVHQLRMAGQICRKFPKDACTLVLQDGFNENSLEFPLEGRNIQFSNAMFDNKWYVNLAHINYVQDMLLEFARRSRALGVVSGYYTVLIWRFPEVGVPANHPF